MQLLECGEKQLQPSQQPPQPSGMMVLRQNEAPPVRIPLGLFCVVTGVSGSGKSKLIIDQLASAVKCFLSNDSGTSPSIAIEGDAKIDELISMDDRPASLSTHSSPVTLLHAWSPIRVLFAATDESRRRNYDIKSFSLTSEQGGRCPVCSGRGYLSVDLQFLPDAQIVCQECRGKRYRPELLEITYRGLNIAETLDLGIQQALTHFRGENLILRRLTSAVSLGLESLRLGQSASQLSTGELQRLRLAQNLGKKSGRHTLFLLDEPTSGLHPVDATRLLESLRQLVAAGQSVIIIDHHPLLLRHADEILDLGIHGGQKTPQLAARGTYSQLIAHHPSSATYNSAR